MRSIRPLKGLEKQATSIQVFWDQNENYREASINLSQEETPLRSYTNSLLNNKFSKINAESDRKLQISKLQISDKEALIAQLKADSLIGKLKNFLASRQQSNSYVAFVKLEFEAF